MAPKRAPPHAAALPPAVLARIMAALAGDTAALCVAACVARAWRDACRAPALWCSLQLEGPAAARLTDAALAKLVARAAGGLTRLDLGGGASAHLALTARGVLAALRDAPPLEALCVRGVRTRPNDVGFGLVEQLRDAVHAPEALDLEHDALVRCNARVDGALCGRLCGRGDELLCERCPRTLCGPCGAEMRRRAQPPCEHVCVRCLRFSERTRPCDDCSNWRSSWVTMSSPFLPRSGAPQRGCGRGEHRIRPGFCDD
jgi:hypothetical protein